MPKICADSTPSLQLGNPEGAAHPEPWNGPPQLLFMATGHGHLHPSGVCASFQASFSTSHLLPSHQVLHFHPFSPKTWSQKACPRGALALSNIRKFLLGETAIDQLASGAQSTPHHSGTHARAHVLKRKALRGGGGSSR
jgi:hypothetical protein